MNEKRRKEADTIEAFCPECEMKTRHRVLAASSAEDPRRARCLTCSHTQEIARQKNGDLDGVGEPEERDEPLADEESAFDGEAVADEVAVIAEGEEERDVESDMGGMLVSAERLSEEEEHAGDEDEDDPRALASMRSGFAEEPEEVEEETESGDDEAEDEAEDDANEEDAASSFGLSSFGRSSFEGATESAETDEEGAPDRTTKRKRKTTKRKAVSVKSHAMLRTWDEEMANVDDRKARSYSLSDTYRSEEIIKHAKFGVGKVVEVVNPFKIAVLFRDGRKMMLQGQR